MCGDVDRVFKILQNVTDIYIIEPRFVDHMIEK